MLFCGVVGIDLRLHEPQSVAREQRRVSVTDGHLHDGRARRRLVNLRLPASHLESIMRRGGESFTRMHGTEITILPSCPGSLTGSACQRKTEGPVTANWSVRSSGAQRSPGHRPCAAAKARAV